MQHRCKHSTLHLPSGVPRLESRLQPARPIAERKSSAFGVPASAGRWNFGSRLGPTLISPSGKATRLESRPQPAAGAFGHGFDRPSSRRAEKLRFSGRGPNNFRGFAADPRHSLEVYWCSQRRSRASPLCDAASRKKCLVSWGSIDPSRRRRRD